MTCSASSCRLKQLDKVHRCARRHRLVGLTSACHHHAYELTSTAAEIQYMIDEVVRFLGLTADNDKRGKRITTRGPISWACITLTDLNIEKVLEHWPVEFAIR